MEENKEALTDRDVMLALFKTVSALAEKLTGERLTVCVKNAAGQSFYVCSSEGSWKPIDQAGLAPLGLLDQVRPTP